ncbi:MAG: restriction endonuclease [Actinobacteria bacterium]|nr:restriction endonuclease [Actinomycetota bacterium]
MPVPDYQTLMRPVLALMEDGAEWKAVSIRDVIIREFQLTPEEIDERLPSGRDTTLRNRVGWALTYLYRAGLTERPRRSIYVLTDRGREVLRSNPNRVDNDVLNSFEEFREFRSRDTPTEPRPTVALQSAAGVGSDSATPEERAASAYRELRTALASEVLDRVREQSPEFFEQVVLDVLQAIGYGGPREDAAERLGQSGDGGVDGVIREDKLGLDLIYVQAKRWANTVGRPELQQFVGALNGQRASKGVFITTSTFSREAIGFADNVNPRVILVDGKELAELMLDHDVGVTIATRYDIKRIDLDYFGVEEDGPGAAPMN